jgi:hypothetical protein
LQSGFIEIESANSYLPVVFQEASMTTPDLRPLSFGELLDRTFSLYRKNFWTFVGIMAIPQVFIVAASVLSQNTQTTAIAVRARAPELIGVMFGYLAAAMLMIVAYFVVLTIALGATTIAVSELYLGRTVTIRAAYQRVRKRIGSLFRLIFSVYARVFGWLITVILAPVAVLTILKYSLATPALLIENLTSRDALKRSRVLTKGQFGRIALAGILTLIMSWVIAFVIQGPFSAAAMLMVVNKVQPPAWLNLLSLIAGGLSGAFAGPLYAIALALIYYDVRVRKEGYDLQLMVEALGGAAPAEERAGETAVPGGPQLRKKSVVLVVFLSLITFGLYVPIWFLARRTAINNLRSREKISGALMAFVVFLQTCELAAIFISESGGIRGTTEKADAILRSGNLLGLIGGIIILVQCFKVKRILLDHFSAQESGPFSGTISLQRDVSLSGVATFFFQILYLQYKINRLLEATAVSAV